MTENTPPPVKPKKGGTPMDKIHEDSFGELTIANKLNMDKQQKAVKRSIYRKRLEKQVPSSSSDKDLIRRVSSRGSSRRISQYQHEGIDEVLHVFDLHAPEKKYQWNASHTKVFRNGGHLEENWLNEFLDLILVAALIKLGDGLHHCGLTYEEYFFVCIEFFLLFKTRYMIDEFMWHFYMDDLWNQILFFAFICGVFLMTLMVSYTHEDDGSGTFNEVCNLESFHMNVFLGGLIATRVVLSMYWVVELFFDAEARDSYYMIPIRNMCTIALGIVGIILNTTSETFDRFNNYYILLVIVILEYYLNFYKGIHRRPLIEVNTFWPVRALNIKTHDHDHEMLFECDEELKAVQERCGQFMLIVLGESMIQLLIPSFRQEHRDGMLTLTLFGLLLVWSIAKQFFDAAQRVPSDHALRRCMQSGMLWIVFHSVAGWFAFLVGIGLKLLYEDLREEVNATTPHVMCLSCGCGGTVMAFTFMRFLHKGWGEYPANINRMLGYSLRIAIAALHFSVIAWGIDNPSLLVIIHCVIAVFLNSLDLYNFKADHVVELDDDTRSETDDGASVVSDISFDGISAPRENSGSNLWQGMFKGREARAQKRRDDKGGLTQAARRSSHGDSLSSNSPRTSSNDLVGLNTDGRIENGVELTSVESTTSPVMRKSASKSDILDLAKFTGPRDVEEGSLEV